MATTQNPNPNPNNPPDATRRELIDTFREAMSYPLQVSGSETRGSATSNTPGSLNNLVNKTIGEVLGWRVRSSDSKGFRAALNHSFSVQEKDGYTIWKWTPRTYAVQADMGEITGPQASIYTRAKVTLENALPLLDGLVPLIPDSDDEDTESLRANIRTEVTELVTELGAIGGPIVQRVEKLLEVLFGNSFAQAVGYDPEHVAGQLGELRDEFGIGNLEVNTVDEEQNFTNFFIFVNYIDTLRLNWITLKRYFDRAGKDVFFGTHLTLISRVLVVIADSVDEVYDAMDSVLLEAAEREATLIPIANSAPITIAELLGWVERFASDEGPQLIADGGKNGVYNAFVPMVTELARLVNLVVTPALKGLPKSYYAPRVQSALKDLASQLDSAKQLAGDIPRPGPSDHKRIRGTEHKINDIHKHIAELDADIEDLRNQLNNPGNPRSSGKPAP